MAAPHLAGAAAGAGPSGASGASGRGRAEDAELEREPARGCGSRVIMVGWLSLLARASRRAGSSPAAPVPVPVPVPALARSRWRRFSR